MAEYEYIATAEDLDRAVAEGHPFTLVILIDLTKTE